MKYYMIDEQHNITSTDDINAFAAMFGQQNKLRVVKQESFFNDTVKVSTVFLAIDHRFNSNQGDPILFETMIFGGDHDQYQTRCCTYQQALRMHKKAVKLIFEVT